MSIDRGLGKMSDCAELEVGPIFICNIIFLYNI